MNYRRIYNQLVERAKTRTLNEYTEKHRIVPGCLGGTYDPSNVVRLTPEEHYVAHQLLVKMYPNSPPLIRAAQMMIPNRPSNKMYGWLRRKYSKVVSEAQSGEGNSQFGTRWIHSREKRISRKIPKNDILPDGWKVGRVINFDKPIVVHKKRKIIDDRTKRINRINAKHTSIRRSESYIQAKAKRLYEEFSDANISLRKFSESKNMVPMTLSNWFNKYIDEYDIEPRKSANKQIGADVPKGGTTGCNPVT